MITPVEKKVFVGLKNNLLELTDILEIKLFGSRARMDHSSDSDYDILIVVPSLSAELKNRIREMVWETGFEHDMFISALIVSRKEWYESPLKVSPIKKAIEREGVFV